MIIRKLKTKRLWLLSIPMMALFGCSNDKHPNIIFILGDDLGYGDLGSYGQKDIKTPNLDRLASEGMRFTQAYSGSTVCAPSRSALMTGFHTGKTFIRNNGLIGQDGERVGLPASTITIAKLLQQEGYSTGVFGKWGLGEEGTEGIPNLQGFDDFFGFLNQGLAHNYYVEHLWHNQQEISINENSDGKRVTHSAELIFSKLKDFIFKNKSNPFFIYYATQLPHAELLSTEADMQQYLNEKGESIFEEQPFEGKNRHTPTDKPFASYAAMVSQLDRHVGELVSLLEENGLEDNTIIFFTSDNGPHKEGGYNPQVFNSSGGLRGIKRDLYEGGIRVPLIVKWPGIIPSNSVSDYIWANWDFFPTALEIAGADIPPGLDGIPSLSVLKGETMERPNPLYWEFITATGAFRLAVRNGKWKGVAYNLSEELQLFDIENDPFETNNLASEFPHIVKELKEIIREERVQSDLWPADEELMKIFLSN